MERARALLVQAQKKEQGWGFWNPDKWEQAAELYVQAANAFKVAKAWKESGDAFSMAAEAYVKANSNYDAAQKYIEAGQSYKKQDVKSTIQNYFCEVNARVLI